jgi:predicted MFS family arabinose efflux permease
METNLSGTTPAYVDLTTEANSSAPLGVLGTGGLMIAHCAGMIDLVALPVWVGALIGSYGLDPQQAGLLATLFLAGAVLSSLFFSPRLNRLPARAMATIGFGIATIAFLGIVSIGGYFAMAALHAIAGLAVGCALSFTHGTIGRSRNPHRLFAIAGLALGIFAIAFLGATPGLIAAHGGPMLFKVFAGVMGVAALACAFAFPSLRPQRGAVKVDEPRFERAVWFGMLGVSCMGLTQAMLFSFVQRIGLDRGFAFDAVTATLIACGFVNLFPAPIAGVLETRLAARRVLQIGPVVQAAIALIITQSAGFAPYAAATSVFAAVMIFSHTFAFGLLARIDRTGRAVAATPAMLMTGAAIGPVLGGTLVKQSGYGSLGIAAVVIAAVAVFCFSRVEGRSSSSGAQI